MVPSAAPFPLTKEEICMLLDVRTYTCRPGTIKAHIALYEKLGKTPQTRHLGQPLAYLVTESGNLNQYIRGPMRSGLRTRRKVPGWARWGRRRTGS
jgi:hypothetical protein